MALQETELEFILGFKPPDACRMLEAMGFLSEAGCKESSLILDLIERAIADWDPEETGPSYVHDLAKELMRRGFISQAGTAAHGLGPRPFDVHFAKFGRPKGS